MLEDTYTLVRLTVTKHLHHFLLYGVVKQFWNCLFLNGGLSLCVLSVSDTANTGIDDRCILYAQCVCCGHCSLIPKMLLGILSTHTYRYISSAPNWMRCFGIDWDWRLVLPILLVLADVSLVSKLPHALSLNKIDDR